MAPPFFPPWHSAGGFDALEHFAGPRLGFQAAAPSLRSREGTALWDGGDGGYARAVRPEAGGCFFWWNIEELFSGT